MNERTGRRVENNFNTKRYWDNVDQAANKAPEWIKGYVNEITEPIRESTFQSTSNGNQTRANDDK